MTIEQHNYEMEDNNCKLITGLFNRTVKPFSGRGKGRKHPGITTKYNNLPAPRWRGVSAGWGWIIRKALKNTLELQQNPTTVDLPED